MKNIEFIHSKILTDFPSGSAIVNYEGALYVIGDDARLIQVVSETYEFLNGIPIYEHGEKRIPKSEKPDLESAAILDWKDSRYLIALGSAARRNRQTGILMHLGESSMKPESFDYSEFCQRLNKIPELNIEGATVMNAHLILGNRGNETHRTNHLIFTSCDFWLRQSTVPLSVSSLVLPPTLNATGISEICYVESRDLLLLTLTTELTSNSYDDGAIGDSYVAWIKNFSSFINSPTIKPDGFINLSESDKALKGEKVEGICVSEIRGNDLVVHLVSDDDQGHTGLFCMKLTID